MPLVGSSPAEDVAPSSPDGWFRSGFYFERSIVMSALSTIKARTSYRGKFKNTSVPREDLIKIMEAGLAAPSGCNTQTTSLIAVDDPELLSKLYKVNGGKADTAPAMICVLTQEIVAYRDRCFNIHDYSAAIENMLIAIVELGYESCWYEGYITDVDKIGRQMADILDVPQDYELVCFLPVGIAAEPLSYVEKKPFEERAWFNGFKK
jgi:nitroreductase